MKTSTGVLLISNYVKKKMLDRPCVFACSLITAYTQNLSNCTIYFDIFIFECYWN